MISLKRKNIFVPIICLVVYFWPIAGHPSKKHSGHLLVYHIGANETLSWTLFQLLFLVALSRKYFIFLSSLYISVLNFFQVFQRKFARYANNKKKLQIIQFGRSFSFGLVYSLVLQFNIRRLLHMFRKGSVIIGFSLEHFQEEGLVSCSGLMSLFPLMFIPLICFQ